MRIISHEELNAVSGGSSEAFLEWLDHTWDSIAGWFGSSSGSNTENIQTVTIRATRMSDAEIIAYDIQQGFALAPGCEFSYVINPTSITVGVSTTVSVTPSGTASGSRTTTTASKSWKCPPNQQIP